MPWLVDDFAASLTTVADATRTAYLGDLTHFVEWADLWSMGDLIAQCLSAGNGAGAVRVYGERYEMSAHLLPDKGVLARHLANAGPRQHPETEWLVTRLQEALESWDKVTDRAVLLRVAELLRERPAQSRQNGRRRDSSKRL